MTARRVGWLFGTSLLCVMPHEAWAVEGGAPDRTTSHAVAIARGSPSADAVTCSGTLVSANVVLTVRHCIASVLSGAKPCDATLGPIASEDATRFWVDVAPWTGAGASWKRVKSARVPESTAMCGDDIALLALEEAVSERDAVPARPVVDAPSFLRLAAERSIGLAAFGATRADATDVGTRRSRFDIPIGCVPGEPAFSCGPELDFIDYEREFTTGRGPCRGDSGGGAMPANDRSVILGVLSRGDLGTNSTSCALGVFERTDRWAWLIARAVLDAATPDAPAPGWASALFPASPNVDEFCEGPGSCVAPARCVSLDGRRSWQCAETCTLDSACGSTRRCVAGVCVKGPTAMPKAAQQSCATATPTTSAHAAGIALAIVTLVLIGRRSRAQRS